MDASKDVLDTRLDSRVGKMLELGLKKELEEFYLEVRNSYFQTFFKHEASLETITHGVLQCIGPKEFLSYLKAKELWNTPKGEKLFSQGCEDLKLHTRQYARKQRRWIKGRFYGRKLGEQVRERNVCSELL